jgi:hypothetical protein
MVANLVVIKTYRSQIEAEAAKIVLAENGIKATVNPSVHGTCCGLFAWLFREVDLTVVENNAVDAKRILELTGDVVEALDLAEGEVPPPAS